MAFPAIDDSELVGLDADGERLHSTAELMRRFYDRARWLAEKKPPIHVAWSDGADCAALAGALAFSVSEATLRTHWTIGKALIPAVGNATGIVRLYVRQESYSSGELFAGLAVRAMGSGSWIDLGSFTLGTTDNWRSGTFTVPESLRDAPLDVWVYLTTYNVNDVTPASGSASTTVTAWSLCSEGTAWPRAVEAFGHFRRQSGVPHDVFTLRLLRDYQDDSAAVPRVLANHSFSVQAGVGVNQIERYIIPAPIHAGTLTIHVRCRTTGGSAATLYAACDTTDTTGAGVPASDGSTGFTSSTMAWRTVTVTPTVDVPNYLFVWVDPAGGDTAEIEAVYATQADPADGAITTGVPGWRVLPLSTRDAKPGAAIVASYSGEHAEDAIYAATTMQNRWTDIFATANNAKFWPQALGSVVVPGDWVVTGDGHTDAYDTTSPAFNALAKFTPRWGCTQVAAFASLTTDGVALESDEQLQSVATLDATALNGAGPSAGRGEVARGGFVPFGNATVVPGTASEIEVVAGYVSLNGSPAAGTNEARIEGVSVWELPSQSLPSEVHARGYAASGAAIPDNDIVTGVSSSIVIATAFTVKYPRVRVRVNHANAAQLKMTLTDGTTTRRLADFADLSGSGSQVFSFSDAYADDTVPDQTLAAFAGVSSADTWTLTVYDNAAGSTGTLTDWALELW